MIARRAALACALVAVVMPFPARAADAPRPLPGDKAIDAYLRRQAERMSGRFLDGAKTLDEWQARKPRLRREYLDMLGLWPLPAKTPLHVKVTGTLKRDGVVIEKLHYQSRPGLYVTANLYRPKKPGGRLPAILYVCGHSGRGRDGNKTAFQDHGMWFASNGYVCLILDTLQLGEVAGKHHGTYNLGRWWWQARGYTPAGVECWNGIRGIDYLVSRPDVDAGKIGVTGISGGGASTVWISAADERVKVAVPVSGMSDLESYVSHKVINGHCDCMFMVNTYEWEWTTILAQVAPRPLLFANSDNDRIFPMDGNGRIIARLRQLYRLYDKPELVDEHISKGGHDYRPDLRIAVFKWFNKHLKGDTGPVKDADSKPLPGKELRVFAEDKDIPADALNARIDETVVPRAVVKLPEAKGFEAWKKGLMWKLREQSFRTFPARIPAARWSAGFRDGDVTGFGLYHTEPEITVNVRGHRQTPGGKAEGKIALLVVLNDGDKEDAGQEWLKPFVGGSSVHFLNVRGVNENAWTHKSPPNYVRRAHALLGRTVDEGRVWDVAAVVRALDVAKKGKVAWRVVGRGQAGVIVAYAALFEPSMKEVVVIDPPASHRDGPIFLNVLRVLDIPDALGLLAPRPLTLVGAKDKAFDRTVRIYKLAGAADRLRWKK